MATDSSQTASKRWGFRLLALLLAVVPFLVAEGVFALLGKGEPDLSEDPFVGFKKVTPLFEKNEAGDRYEILNESRLEWFYPQSFPADKGDNTFRVFCVGGSTVAGRPYSVEPAFSSWLDVSCNTSIPKSASH